MGQIYNDNTPMPFGKYAGTALANVPASYLMYLFNNNLRPGPLRQYIIDNIDAIKKEIDEKENS